MSKSTIIEDIPVPDEDLDDPVLDHRFNTPAATPDPVNLPVQPQSWQTLVLSPPFLKALFLAFAVILTALVVPLETYAFKYLTILEDVPHATECIKAIVAAAAITFLRPPQ
jgi:hypothetical protein